MNIVKTIVFYLTVLLSAAAGVAKVMRTPQEVEFFAAAGFGVTALIVLGAMQIAGAALGLPQATRRIGAAVVAGGFLVSAAAIFITGNIGFGVVSLIPAALAGYFTAAPPAKH